MFDGWGIFLDCLQDARGSNDGRIQEVLFDLARLGIEVEGTRCVHDRLEWRVTLDGMLKSPLLRNILNDSKIKPFFWNVGVSILDFIGLFLRADGRDYGVTMVEQDIENMCGDEATSAWYC